MSVLCGNEVRGRRQNFYTILLTLCKDARHNINVNHYGHSLQTISAFNLDQSCIASFLTCLPGLILISVSVTLAFCPTCPCLGHSAIPQGQTPLEGSSSIFFPLSFWLCHLPSLDTTQITLKRSCSSGWGTLCLRQRSRKLGGQSLDVFRIRLKRSEH